MGVTDWFLVIPFLPLAIVLATVLGPSTLNLIIVIGITSWAGTARLIRAQTLSIEGRPYIERSRALGAGNWHQMTRHVLPNVFPLVLANTTLTVAIVILSETTLSFLGLGDPLPIASAHGEGCRDLMERVLEGYDAAALAAIPDAVPRDEPLHRFANRPYHVMGQSFVPATELRPFRQRGRPM